MFYADEAEWMALPEGERNTAIGRIGTWFGELARAGTIVGGERLAGGKRATTTVRLGRGQRGGDAPIVAGGPLVGAKEAGGSDPVGGVKGRDAADANAQRRPGGGVG